MTGLGPRAEAEGFRLVRHEALASTMDEAVAAARAGDPGRLWILAGRQTAGRGRHGRVWSSGPGNLHATLLLKDPCAPARAPELGFVAGLALMDALRGLTKLGDRIRLKWPNDLLVDGAKLAGILLEGLTLEGRSHAAAIGLGVNVARHPEGLAYPATSLAALGETAGATDLFAALSDAMAARLRQWRAGAEFSALREDWMKAAAGLGSPIAVALVGRTLHGLFREIDAGGRLVLATPEGPRTIEAGDVLLPREAA